MAGMESCKGTWKKNEFCQMYQKVTGQSKTTSPEHCPYSKPRKPSKVSIPRHFILCQESLWVCLYREHTETSAGYSGRCVHTHGQETHRCTSHPTKWALEQACAPAKAAAVLQPNRGTEHGSPSWPCTLCPHLLPLLLSAGNLLLGRLSVSKSVSPVFGGTHGMCCLKRVGRTLHQ